jgi:dTDP-D-glucose 4,6-dehydratase
VLGTSTLLKAALDVWGIAGMLDRGETYNVGVGNERKNRDVVGMICDLLDRAFAEDGGLPRAFRHVPPQWDGNSIPRLT